MWKRQEQERTSVSSESGTPSAASPAPMPSSAPATPAAAASIGRSVVMKGELSGSEDLMIDGQVEGTANLRQHLLTIGPSAKISAEISAKAVVVLGHARGNITATERIEIRESGSVDGNVSARYCRWLKLHGCVRLDSASDYRLLYRFRADPQAATAPRPFLGEAWSASRLGPGAPIPFVPDAQGWYQVVNASDLVEPNWIFYWSTPSAKYADGVYEVRVELGTAAGGGIVSAGFSPPRTFVVENRGASAQFLDVRWQHAASGLSWGSAPVLDLDNCPVIERNPGQAI